MYSVHKSELELVKALGSDSEMAGRYMTAAVAVTPKYSEITNGHFLVRQYADRLPIADYPDKGRPEGLDTDPGPAPILIPMAVAKAAAAALPKKSTLPILTTALVGRQNGSTVVESTDLDSWNVKKIESVAGAWPDTEKVIPNGSTVATETIGFNPDYLMRIGKLFKDRGVKAVKMELYGPGMAVKMTGAIPDGGRLEAVLMPVVLDK